MNTHTRSMTRSAATTLLCIATLGVTATSAYSAVGPEPPAAPAAQAVREIVCGSDVRGTIGAEIPRSWHLVDKTPKSCPWRSPDGAAVLLFPTSTTTVKEDRRHTRTDGHHYVVHRFGACTFGGLHGGLLWDYAVTRATHRTHFRLVGISSFRLTYHAPQGNFSADLDAFRHARHTLVLAG